MDPLEKAKHSLESHGFTVRNFSSGTEAAAYLEQELCGTTIGIGGSATIEACGLWERLQHSNTVYWHWRQPPDDARRSAMNTQVYLTSVNALAQTGELVSIDGIGNRTSSMLFGHQKIYYLIGRNKIVPTLDDAIWRARNVAAPRRAQQQGRRTPCAHAGDRCYNCQSPERICRGMVILWEPMPDTQTTVLLIDEALGL